jgi:serine/threonine protein kinase
MGEVYRAIDTKLGRDVVLKLLAPGTLDKVSPEHLLREAQTASSLSQSFRFNGPVFAAICAIRAFTASSSLATAGGTSDASEVADI